MKRSGRLSSIDAIRGLAVLLMFFHHFPEYLMKDPYDSETFILMFIVSRLSAPLFLVVVGISMVLSAERRIEKEGKKAAMEHFVKRGFTIMIGGALLNAMIFAGPAEFNILYTIGLSIIFLSAWAINPKARYTSMAYMALLLMSTPAYSIGIAKDILRGFDFPPLPWMVFAVYGIIIGDTVARFRKTGRLQVLVGYLEITAILMMAITAAFIKLRIPLLYQHDATLPFISLTMALTAYLISLSIQFYEVRGYDLRILRPLETFGRYALPIYFIHYVFVITIPHILGLENTMSLNGSLLSLIVFTLGSYLVLEKLEKFRRRSS